jgi:hypothetical protein
MLVSWNHYEKTIEGSVTKGLICEKCGGSYYYVLTRRGVGQGRSLYGLNNAAASQTALTESQRMLQYSLAKDCDPVPCPDCGWFQAAMVAVMRQKRYARWDLLVGGVPAVIYLGFLVGAIATSHNMEINPVAAILAAILAAASGFGIGMFRRALRARYDPNARFPERPELVPGAPPALRTPPG